METGTTVETDHNLPALIHGIITDTQQLVEKRIALFRHECRDALESMKWIAVLLVLGMVCGFSAVLLLGQMTAYLLQSNLEWPLWACFGGAAVLMSLLSLLPGLLAYRQLRKLKVPTAGNALEGGAPRE